MSVVKQMADRGKELAGLQKAGLGSLQPTSSLLNRYVTGQVQSRTPLVTRGKMAVFKLVLQESPSALINVYVLGDFAVGLDPINNGDTLFISNGVLERSHTVQKDHYHECHLMIDKNRSHPLVWISPQQGNNQDPHSAATAAASSTTISSTTASAKQSAAATPATSTSATTCVAATAAVAATSATTTSTAAMPSSTAAQNNNGSPLKTTHTGMVQVLANGSSSPLKSLRMYKYTSLKDIKESRSVDVYGIIKFFKLPYKTRGPDYCMLLTIVDPSLGPDEHGLKCVFFHQDVQKLPQVHSIGDVIRLHRLRIQSYQGDYQGTRGSGFSCVVFDGKPSAPMEPRASSENFTLTDEDKTKVQELRDWAAQQTVVPLASKNWTLSEMVTREYFDLTCQVVAMATLPAENCVLIKVWDGTKYKWPVRSLDVSQVEVKWDTELACRAEGLVLDVALYDNHMKAGEELKPGQFIRLYNLHAAQYTPPNAAVPAAMAAASSIPAKEGDNTTSMIELVLHRGTAYGRGLVVMQEWDKDIRLMKQRMEDISKNRPTATTTKQKPSTQPTTQSQPRPSQPTGSAGNYSLINGIELDEHDWQLLDDSSQVPGGQPQRETDALTSVPTSSSLGSGQELRCMQEPNSVVTSHHNVQFTSVLQMLARPLLFRLKVRVVDFFPRSVEDFVHLFCPQCRKSCRIPRSVSESPNLSSKRGRKRKVPESQTQAPSSSIVHSSEESPRRSQRIRRRKGEPIAASDASQESNRTKGEKSKSKRVTAVIQDDSSGPQGEQTSLAYVKDLSVQESLELMREGMQLVRVPRVTKETRRRGRQEEEKTSLYVCPTCCPDPNNTDGEVVFLQHRWWLKLWLQDSTEKVEAILQGQEAELFFDVSTTELKTNAECRKAIADKMQRLCPTPGTDSPDTGEGPMELECCVERHVSCRGAERIVNYYMRDTKLALDVR